MLRHNEALLLEGGYTVSNLGFFVYCNRQKSRDRFDGQLLFDMKVISYVGSDSWIEVACRDAYACLCSPDLPAVRASDCEQCAYFSSMSGLADLFDLSVLPSICVDGWAQTDAEEAAPES